VAYICLTGIGVLGALQERANKNNQPPVEKHSTTDFGDIIINDTDPDTEISQNVSMYSKKGPKFST
jgi:hypothetical protein